MHVGWHSGDCRSALWGTRSSGLDADKELFDLEDLLGGELGELGIGGDKGFEDGLFIGDHSCHVVKVTVELGERGQASGGICVGWHGGNTVDGSGCRGAAERFAMMARSALFALNHLLCLAGPGLPCWPRLCGGCEAIPVKPEHEEAAGREEGHGGNGGKPVIHDGKMGAGGFPLGVLESVDVLGEAGVFGPPAEHCSLEVHDVCGFKTTTA